MNFLIRIVFLAACCPFLGCSEAKHSLPGQKEAIDSKKPECTISDLWTNDPDAYRISIYPATDSASSATAMATGRKTIYGSISVVPGEENQPKTIAEILKERGGLFGVVTSVPFNHATPAAFLTHVKDRGNYSEIAEQILKHSKPDVVIGGGHPSTSRARYFSKEAWNSLLENRDGAYSDYDVIGLNNCRVGSDVFTCSPEKQLKEIVSNGRSKLVAVLGDQVLCSKCGEGGVYVRGMLVPPGYHLSPDLSNAGYKKDGIENRADENPRLKDAVHAALAVLERRAKKSSFPGSFLMVEGGDVDWAGHSNDFAWMLAAMHEFEEAVKAVSKYLDMSNNYNWDNTLVIVTADHACSFMRVDKEALMTLYKKGQTPHQEWAERPGPTNNGRFDDGEWSFGRDGSNAVQFKTTDHTNELVTIVARGRGAHALFTDLEKNRPCGADRRAGLIDNTQIFQGMKRAIDRLGTKHVILMIADGMHEAQEVAYSIMQYGREGKLEWDRWSENKGPNVYRGKVTTWDISTYDWFACNKGKPPYKPGNCESQLGYDEAMTPKDSSSIGATSVESEAYFLTVPKRR